MLKTTAKKIEPATLSVTLDPSLTAAAYAKYKPAAVALRAAGLANPTVHVTTAVAIATAGANNLLLHRAEVDLEESKAGYAGDGMRWLSFTYEGVAR